MNKKNTLYNAYLEQKKEKEVKDKILKKYNISNDKNTVIISKSKNRIGLFLWDVLCKLTKAICYLIITILVTIGATVILNAELRQYILNFL